MKIFFKTILFFLGCLQGEGINSQNNCKNLKKGQFYYTTSINDEKIIIIRSDTLQQEINVTKPDTSFYKLEWVNDCTYTTKFLRKNHSLSEYEKQNIYPDKLFFEIVSVKNDYYTYRASFGSLNSKLNFTDTIWIKK